MSDKIWMLTTGSKTSPHGNTNSGAVTVSSTYGNNGNGRGEGMDDTAETAHLMSLGLAIAGGVAVAGTLWWLTRESYYSYVPPRYQYRPGTISAWFSRVLERHAKRRRSKYLVFQICV